MSTKLNSSLVVTFNVVVLTNTGQGYLMEKGDQWKLPGINNHPLSELSFLQGRGPSVCDRQSPIFSGPPFWPSLDPVKKPP